MACLMRSAVGARALFARATVHSVAFSRARFVTLPFLAWGPPFLHVNASRRVSHLSKGASGLVCSGAEESEESAAASATNRRMNHQTAATAAHALDTASPGNIKNCHLQMSLLAIYTYTHARTHSHTRTHVHVCALQFSGAGTQLPEHANHPWRYRLARRRGGAQRLALWQKRKFLCVQKGEGEEGGGGRLRTMRACRSRWLVHMFLAPQQTVCASTYSCTGTDSQTCRCPRYVGIYPEFAYTHTCIRARAHTRMPSHTNTQRK